MHCLARWIVATTNEAMSIHLPLKAESNLGFKIFKINLQDVLRIHRIFNSCILHLPHPHSSHTIRRRIVHVVRIDPRNSSIASVAETVFRVGHGRSIECVYFYVFIALAVNDLSHALLFAPFRLRKMDSWTSNVHTNHKKIATHQVHDLRSKPTHAKSTEI